MITRSEERELFTADGPSLEKLAIALRHQELWPDDFHWDFGDCYSCAMGLAAKLWNGIGYVHTRQMAESFKISKRAAQDIFLGANYDNDDPTYTYGHDPDTHSYKITPEMVANAIDKYLEGVKKDALGPE